MFLFKILWIIALFSENLKLSSVVYGQEDEIISELNEDAIFKMYELNENPKTSVLLLYSPGCSYSKLVYDTLVQVQEILNDDNSYVNPTNNKTNKINFYKHDVTSKEKKLVNDYKKLFQKLNISTNIIPQIRVILTYRLPSPSYKINEVVYTYPKIISSTIHNTILDIKQFISFYHLRYSYSTSSKILNFNANYKFTPVVTYIDKVWLNDWLSLYKNDLFYHEQQHVVLFNYQTCSHDNNVYNDIHYKNYHQIAKYMSHYYHHVLFIQSLLNCDMNTINETKFEVIYYDISLNTTIWDRKDNIVLCGDNTDESTIIFFLQYHALPIVTNISSTTTHPNFFTSLSSSDVSSLSFDYKYSYPSSTYYSNTIKVHTTLFLSSSSTSNVLVNGLYDYSYNLRFINDSSSAFWSYFFIIPNNENNQRIIDYFNISSASNSTSSLLITDSSSNGGLNKVSSSLLRKFYWYVDDRNVSIDTLKGMNQFMDSFWDNKLYQSTPSYSTSNEVIEKETELEDNKLITETTNKILQIKSQESFDKNVMNNPNKVLLYVYSSSYCSHVQATYPIINDYHSNITLSTSSSVQVMKLNIDKYPIYHPNMDVIYLPALFYFPSVSNSSNAVSINSYPVSYGCDSITNMDDVYGWIRYVDDLLEDDDDGGNMEEL